MGVSEILEPIHGIVRELLESDKRGTSQNIKYTDDDVMAATLLYSHVLGNRLIHTLTDEKASIGIARELSVNYSAMIRQLTLAMSRVDTNRVYKKENTEKKESKE